MSDISLAFNPAYARADWTIAAGQVVVGTDLETAVLVSLFTDRLLPEDIAPTDGSTDRRGWWGDTYRNNQIGSLLWTLDRAIKSNAKSLLASAQKMCLDALQWLVDDGVAATVTVETQWLTPTAIGISITITDQTGLTNTFRYAWAWGPIGLPPLAPTPGSTLAYQPLIPADAGSFITADGKIFEVWG